jgi:hypothetical protein
MIVFMHRGQVSALLCCWLWKANIFRKKIFATHSARNLPGKKTIIDIEGLSHATMTRRVEDIGSDLFNQITSKAKQKYLKTFAQRLDDTSNTAQLSIIIPRVTEYFEMVEELPSLQSLQGTSIRKDLFLSVCVTTTELELPW